MCCYHAYLFVFSRIIFVFIVKTGGGGGGGVGSDGLSLRFILFLRHGLCGEVCVLLCRFAYIGFV